MSTFTGTGSIMAGPSESSLGQRWGWLLALGIVQIIAGSIAITVPLIACLIAVGIFGALLITTGIMQLVHAFQLRSWPRSAWYGLGGVLYGIAGIAVVAHPLGGALTLAILIAIQFFADGTLRIVFGMTIRPVVGWGWLVAAGLGSIVVGVILLVGWPATALWATGLLLGVNLIFSGIMNATLAISTRHTASS